MRNLYGKLRLLIDGTYAALAESLQRDSRRISTSYATVLENRVLFSASPVPVELIDTVEAVVQPESRELVFVDTTVDDYQRLVDSLVASDEFDREFHVFLLDSETDGVDYISQVLADYDDVDAIHLISHGFAGNVRLGSTWLNVDNLGAYAGQIGGWHDALSEDADLLIYGCNLAANDDGRELVESLSVLTTADVAASDDLTGHASLGADWRLEFTVGVIQADIAFTMDVQQSWFAVLPNTPPIIALGSPLNYNGGDPLTVIDAGATAIDSDSPNYDTGQLTVTFTANSTSDDRLEIDTSGDFNLSGGNVRYQPGGPPTIIGTWSGGTDGSTPLVIAFNSDATPAIVEELVRSIGYRNVAASPSDLSRTVEFQLTDDLGAASNVETVTINMLGINAAPVNSVPGTQSTPQDTPLTFSSGNSNQISISDPGAGGANVEITLTATNGTVTVNLPYDPATPTSGEFSLSSNNSGIQRETQVASLPDGRFVVVWSGDGPGDGDGIWMRQFNADLTPVANQTRINGNGAKGELQSMPTVAVNDAGRIAVAWTSNNQDSPGTDGVYFRAIDWAGGNDTGEIRANSVARTAGNQLDPTVEIDESGNVIVVWTDKDAWDGQNEGLFARRFDSAGTAVDVNEWQVNTYWFSKQENADIVMHSDGSFVIVWESLNQELLGTQYGIYGKRYDASANPLDAPGTPGVAEFQVNVTEFKNQHAPSIAMDASGNFAVVWASQDQAGDGDDDGIFGQLYDAAGNKTGPVEFQVNTATAWDQSTPSVAMDASGNFVVAWEHDEGEFGPKDIRFRQFNRTATAVGTEQTANSPSAGEQNAPDVAMDTNGNFVIVWDGQTTTEGDGGAVARQYNVPPPPLTFSVGDGAADDTMTFQGTIANVNSVLDGMIFSPTPAFTGTASVQIVTDDLGNTGFGSSKFDDDTVDINVTAGGNTAPTITPISDQTIVESGSTNNLAFTIDDAETPVGSLIVTASSDDLVKIPNGNIVLNDLGGGNWDVSATGAVTETGTVTITVTVDDGSTTTDEIFDLTIIPRIIAVTTTIDEFDGDVTDIASLIANQGGTGISLREAIAATNNTTVGVTPDEIHFNFANGDPNHLYYKDNGAAGLAAPTVTDGTDVDFDIDDPYGRHSWFRMDVNGGPSELTITDDVTIDGYTQSGATQNTSSVGHDAALRVELTNTGSDGFRGLTFDTGADGSTVRGLAINAFDWSGVMVEYDVDNVTVQGNFIGTDITGTVDIGNGDSGVQLRGNSGLVGGPNMEHRNVISGSNNRGVALYTLSTITGNLIENNYIGADATGLNGLGNAGSAGIQLYGGDGTQVLNNVIVDNAARGIRFLSGNPNVNTVIQGNFIGLGADGSTQLGNIGVGIEIDGTTSNITIGGTDAGEENVISDNVGHGIFITRTGATDSTITGNLIGTDATGLLNRGNTGNGIYADLGANDHTIGGILTDEGNVIAFNGGAGVGIKNATTDQINIRGNAIYSNTGLGIDIRDDSLVEANDLGDGDGGANEGQNFPVLTSASITGIDLNVTGSLNSTPTTAFDFDFFASTTADASGHGEAARYIGSEPGVSTDVSGNLTFGKLLTGANVVAGEFITATATDQNGNTSEFALNFVATNTNTAPTGSVTVTGTPTEDQILTASNSLADVDGLGPISYQWQRNGSDITGETGTTYTLDDIDVGQMIRVVASYTDGGGTPESVNSSAVGPIAAVNDAPGGAVNITGTPTEDQILTAGNTLTDVDGLGTISYQWQRNGTDITGETGTTYTLDDIDVGQMIRVVASYTDGQGFDESVNSTAVGPIANVNDPPTVAANTGMTVLEGATGTTITTAMLNEGDPDDVGTGLTYMVTTLPANGTLRLSGGAIPINGTFTQSDIDSGFVTYDHNGSETTGDSFVFSLADGGEDGATPAVGTFMITVTPVNDPVGPVSDSDLGDNEVDENVIAGTSVGVTASATDPDGTDTVSYSLLNDASLPFTVNSLTGEVTVDGTLDHESTSSYAITVTATSTDGSSSDLNTTINITDINESPTIALANLVTSLAEVTDMSSAVRIADIVVADDSLGINNLSLSGPDAAEFEIVGNELRLRAGTPLSFTADPLFEVTVEVDDLAISGTPDDSVSHNLNITDTNALPTVSLTNIVPSLLENTNTSSAIRVADIVVSDDGTGTNSLALSGADAASFEIVGTELRLRAGEILDFETAAMLDVSVEVDDTAIGLTPDDTVSQTLNILDVNEPPTVAFTNLVNSLSEDTSTVVAIRVADIVISDDTLGTNSLSLSGSDAGKFEIVGNELQLKAGELLDFETDPSFDVTVEVDDLTLAPAPNDVASHTLLIGDSNEAPTVIGISSDTMAEDSSGLTFDLTTWFADPDAGDIVTGTVIGSSSWLTGTIGPGNMLIVTSAPDANGSGQVTVRGIDTSGLFVDKTVSINVTAVDDTPVAVNQSIATSGPVAILLAGPTDVDGDPLVASIVAGPTNGSLSTTGPGGFVFTPDAGFTGTDSFTFLIDDGITPSNVATVVITVSVPIPPPTVSVIPPDPEPVPAVADDEEKRSDETATPLPTVSSGGLGSVDKIPEDKLDLQVVETFVEKDNGISIYEPEVNLLPVVQRLVMGNAIASAPGIVELVNTQFATDSYSLTQQLAQPGLIWDALDEFKESAKESSVFQLQSAAVGSVATVSSGLIVGYVIWALRSGLLLSSLLATMPAWNLFDPLAVVAAGPANSTNKETLEDIVESEKEKLSRR